MFLLSMSLMYLLVVDADDDDDDADDDDDDNKHLPMRIIQDPSSQKSFLQQHFGTVELLSTAVTIVSTTCRNRTLLTQRTCSEYTSI